MPRLFIPALLSLLAALSPISEAQAQTIFPNRGGLGTTTPPAYGQIPVGNAQGTYTLTATSSLGIAGTEASSSPTFGAVTATTGTSSLQNLSVPGTTRLATLTGLLKAVSGYVTTALVNLASDVQGVLGTGNGGTGTSSPQGFLYGNGSIVSTSTISQNFIDPALARVSALSGYLTLSSWYATTTDALDEGATNRYFTDARVGSYISGSSTVPHIGGTAFGDLLYWTGSDWGRVATSSLGLTATADGTFSTTSADFWDTTKARWATTSANYHFNTKSTTDIAEGSNFYFTTARVFTYLDSLTKGYFFSTTSTAYWETQQTPRTADDLGNNTTSDLAEGSNLYYTDARVGSYITGSTTLPGFLNYWTKSGSTLSYSGGVTMGNATATNATSTNLYSTKLGINSEHFTDLTGTGLTLSGGALTATLGTSVTGAEIENGNVNPDKLNNVDSASDEECLTFEATGTAFEWQTCGSGGSANAGGSDTQVQFNDGGTSLGGDAGFTYDKTTDHATLGKLTVSGMATTTGVFIGDGVPYTNPDIAGAYIYSDGGHLYLRHSYDDRAFRFTDPNGTVLFSISPGDNEIGSAYPLHISRTQESIWSGGLSSLYINARASSTIGNGQAGGGLTVSGSATTSLNATTTGAQHVGSLTVGSLSGFVKATAGKLATSLVNLASDVTGILPDANVADTITLTNITQVTNRAVSSLTGNFVATITGTTNEISVSGSGSGNAAVTLSLPSTLDLSGKTVKQRMYPAFSYSTTTSWAGTTTIPLGPAYVAEQWNGVKCFTDTGTLTVMFHDGTNYMNGLQASTTVGTVPLTANNSYTVSEKRYVEIGNPASSPKQISCSVDKTVN